MHVLPVEAIPHRYPEPNDFGHQRMTVLMRIEPWTTHERARLEHGDHHSDAGVVSGRGREGTYEEAGHRLHGQPRASRRPL